MEKNLCIVVLGDKRFVKMVIHQKQNFSNLVHFLTGNTEAVRRRIFAANYASELYILTRQSTGHKVTVSGSFNFLSRS